MLLQTIVFVGWNKVFTAQYFVWVLALLPLELSQSSLGWAWPWEQARPRGRRGGAGAQDGAWSLWRWGVVGAVWAGCVGLWLSQAGLLEDAGVPTFRRVWGAGLLLLLAHACIAALVAISGPPVRGSRGQRGGCATPLVSRQAS